MTRLLLVLSLATVPPQHNVSAHLDMVWQSHRIEQTRQRWKRAVAKYERRQAWLRSTSRSSEPGSSSDGSSAGSWPRTSSTSGTSGTFTATAYAPGCGDSGLTASRTTPGPGTIAVDPSQIPLGTPMTVSGYGSGVALDTGGAIGWNRIDLWFPTCAQARAWGVRTVEVSW